MLIQLWPLQKIQTNKVIHINDFLRSHSIIMMDRVGRQSVSKQKPHDRLTQCDRKKCKRNVSHFTDVGISRVPRYYHAIETHKNAHDFPMLHFPCHRHQRGSHMTLSLAYFFRRNRKPRFTRSPYSFIRLDSMAIHSFINLLLPLGKFFIFSHFFTFNKTPLHT